MSVFDHKTIEKKWMSEWIDKKTYQPDMDKAESPYYNLMMFPYPSAEGLHVGNMYAFTGADVFGRYQRMKGNDVFEPIGLDGFGIHSENYAIKVGKHPAEQAKISEERFYKQLSKIGAGYAWDYRLETYDPEYYKWTQWLFVQMFKNGLAYRKSASVNWCPSCMTVLADEQVEDGKCERCKNDTTRKETEQWFFRITKYADELLENISNIDWPHKIKIAQTNWIGKKEGMNISYCVFGSPESAEQVGEVTCFTTRPDTNYGATFVVLAPEHELINQILSGVIKVPENVKKDVIEYVDKALKKTEQQRKEEEKNKTGVDLKLFAINPLNDYKMSIYVSDFVLAGFGTGAVVGVPGHDKRDFEFAKKFNLPIKKVVEFNNETHAVVIKKSVSKDFIKEIEKNNWNHMAYEDWGYTIVIPKGKDKEFIATVQKYLELGPWYVHADGEFSGIIFKDKTFTYDNNIEAEKYAIRIDIPVEQTNWNEEDSYDFCYEGVGSCVNSEFLNGLDTQNAIERVSDYLEKMGWGKRETSYHLRDWLISRQRYWGPPIPMVYCKSCAENKKGERNEMPGWYSVSESELPVELPELSDYKPTGDGMAPLEKADEDFLYTSCPHCGEKAKRETDVSDTFLDSSWYFLRFPSVKTKNNKSFGKSNDLPWDEEITKKWLPTSTYIGGAEHAVLHLLYSRFVWMALMDWKHLPDELGREPFPYLFSHGLIVKDGAKMSKSRGNVIIPDEYIEKYGADTLRMYLMFLGSYDAGGDFRDTGIAGMHKFLSRAWEIIHDSNKVGNKTTSDLESKLHETIKKMNEDFSRLKYNTSIAALMELFNAWKEKEAVMSKSDVRLVVKLFAPLAPFMSEEIWQSLDHEGVQEGENGGLKSVHLENYPVFDPEKIVSNGLLVVVQVNGKKRGEIVIDKEKSDDKEHILDKARNCEGMEKWIEGGVKKEIFVPRNGQVLVNLVV